MAHQDAGKRAKELVEAIKTLSAAQAEIAGLLRHVVHDGGWPAIASDSRRVEWVT